MNESLRIIHLFRPNITALNNIVMALHLKAAGGDRVSILSFLYRSKPKRGHLSCPCTSGYSILTAELVDFTKTEIN
jgi:hypothetical protein